MLSIEKLKKNGNKIVTIGSYPAIIQSILDFDYLCGNKPSIQAIISSGRKYEKYFYGKKEILIPVYPSIDLMIEKGLTDLNYFINLSSARRVLDTTKDVFKKLPTVFGGVIFAENVAEKHSIELHKFVQELDKFVIGPSSVGVVIPGKIKLGAIGGVEISQILDSKLNVSGNLAVFSSSGGMTNELIRSVTATGHFISFSLSFGGDRFPILSPEEAFALAEKDKNTEYIIYFGELGGEDEYEIANLIKEKKTTKKIICFIAGTISEMFETPPQFGHAKAMAEKKLETAQAKKEVLRQAGAVVADTFSEFIKIIDDLPKKKIEYKYSKIQGMENRKKALITSSISKDEGGEVQILGKNILDFSKNNSFAAVVGSLFLGRKLKSKESEEFLDFILKLLVDHGPHVSGAINTIVASRAGKDLVSSLASGLLTIGPRFGGAINQAAYNWLAGVQSGKSAHEFVEDFAKRKIYILGIGHKKYRLDNPDPRVSEIIKFAEKLKDHKFTDFAKNVEKVTTSKKANLILNVDGAIAAVLLDILYEKEGMSKADLKELVDAEFFNSVFVLSRSVGFIAHFLDQKRLDEGILRLEDDMVTSLDS